MSGEEVVVMRGLRVIIRGAGEMASGIAHRLYSAGIRNLLMTEIEKPLAVRRFVSFSEAVYEGEAGVEGVRSVFIKDMNELPVIWGDNMIALIIDPEGQSVEKLRPHILVDAMMMKRRTSTTRNQAPFVIGVGPGFNAPEDVHAVIESNRGHNLGRVIWNGSAEPFTGIPGARRGYTTERVLRSPQQGMVRHVRHISESVKKGDTILYVDEMPVYASIDGVLRGLVREISVEQNEKIGDIDPMGQIEYCYTISDKARAIGGGVLEAVMASFNRG